MTGPMSEPFAQYPYGAYHVPEPPRRRRGRHALGLTVTAIVALAAGAGAGVALSHGSSPSGSTTAASGATSGTSGGTSGGTSKTALTQAQIASRVDPSLVDVTSTLSYDDATAMGTGIVVTSNGEVLTNNHVINGATSIKVTDIGNGRTYTATVVGYDESQDIAVLQLSGASGLTTANFGNSSTVRVGEAVVGIGNAGGVGGTPSEVAGSVTALDQSITASDESSGTSEQLTGLIESNADIQAGDSGGPLVNSYGQIIGVDTAASTGFEFGNGFGGNNYFGGNGSSGSGQESETQGYSIPIDTALSIAQEIEADQASSTVHIGATAFLGLEISSEEYSGGVAIEATVPGTPAAEAGITAGDVVTSIAGQSVSTGSDISQILIGYHPGNKISISWTNEFGQSQSATVTLATGPAA